MKITFDPVFVVHIIKKNTSIFIFTAAKKSTVAGSTERTAETRRMKSRISKKKQESRT